MLSRIIGSSVAGPLFKGLSKIVEVQGVTKQVLAYCAVLKEIAAGTWRPWVARAIMWTMIFYTLVTSIMMLHILFFVSNIDFTGGEDFAGASEKLVYIRSIWQPLGLSIFGFGGAFLGLYSGGRDHSKANASSITMLEALKGHLLPDSSPPEIVKRKVERRAPIKKLDGMMLPEDRQEKSNFVANDPSQKINLKMLESEIEAEEDTVLEIYMDSLGNLTAGIGHLITKDDQEYGQPVGTPVDLSRVKKWFDKDLQDSITAATKLLSNFDHHPQVVKHAFINMAFQLGEKRLSEFKKMIRYLEKFQYNAAGNEGMDSKWSKQTNSRAKRITSRIRSGYQILDNYDLPE